jgi:Carbohydrate esterase, sialic acid-specific acetylesterase
MKRVNTSLLLLLLLVATTVFAQIKVNLPVDRMVFQRNNNQQGTINITGNYYSNIDEVQAKVTPRWVGSGTATNWTTIQLSPTFGYFVGTLVAQQGWYKLDVRGLLNGVEQFTTAVERVGIGEVFAIAGQSNGQGGEIGIGATDDRVNSVNFVDDYSSYNRLPIGFSQLSNSSYVAPFHYGPWFYGKLGDLLTQKLNVPVLFLGGAHGGASSNQYGLSALGLPHDGPTWMKQAYGAPYRALENCITYYGSLTGLRAVIWQQGESDHHTPEVDYFINVKRVVDKTRENTEFSDLAWITAFSSLSINYAQNVINGQNLLVQYVPNFFPGPNTDLINSLEDRPDQIHFSSMTGLEKAAIAWNNSMSLAFFSNSTPMMASPILQPNIVCNGTSLSVSIPSGYSKYAWSNRSNTTAENQGGFSTYCCSYSVQPPAGYETLNWTADSTQSFNISTSGRYSFNAKKSSKKILFGPILHFISNPIPEPPTISASSSQIRTNSLVTLTSSGCPSGITWSTGNTTPQFDINLTNNTVFTATCKSVACSSPSSQALTVLVTNCFNNILNLTGNINTFESPYKTEQKIISNQVITQSGALKYYAKQSIELEAGFEVKTGGSFSTSIEGCL